MLRKVIVSLFFVGLLVGSATAQEKSYHAERFDVDVAAEEDGSLHVTETVSFKFAGGPFTFVFRELETDRTDGVTDIRASVDGRPLPEGDQPGQVEISRGDPVRVEWHLEPFSNDTRTFTLTYRMLGVVRKTDTADLLVYQPLPDEYEYIIDKSTVTFSYPRTAEVSDHPVVTTNNADVRRDGNQVIVIAQDLSPDETIVVEIPFAPSTLIAAPPAWQQQQNERQAATPLWIGAGVILFAVGLVSLIVRYRRYRPSVTPQKRAIYEPPSDLAPAMAGAINGSGAKPAWSNALATLFDLADRGILRIEEASSKKWFRRRDFTIELVQEPANLQPHESGLLDLLFKTKSGRTQQIKLSELGKRISSRHWKTYSEPLEKELAEAGFISQERSKARGRFIAVGVFFIFLATAIAVAAAVLDTVGGLAVAGSFFLLGLVAVLAGTSLSPLTNEGAAVAAEWQHFADHLKNVAKGKAAVSGPKMFQRFLPYAASYGLLEAWAKRFQKEGWTELPPYFYTLSRADDGGVAAFVALAAASGSSGGSAAGATGAAGAGAAGGGASGAG